MRPLLRKIAQSASILCSIAAAGDTHAAPQVRVDVQFPTSSHSVGTTFEGVVEVVNVIDLFAFQFDVSFDPAILRAVRVTEGSFLPEAGPTVFLPGTVDNNVGKINFTAGSLIGDIVGATGSGDLANILFQGVSPGASIVDLSDVVLLNSSLLEIPSAVFGASTTIVSEPTSIALIGIGLLGYIFFLQTSRSTQKMRLKTGEELASESRTYRAQQSALC